MAMNDNPSNGDIVYDDDDLVLLSTTGADRFYTVGIVRDMLDDGYHTEEEIEDTIVGLLKQGTTQRDPEQLLMICQMPDRFETVEIYRDEGRRRYRLTDEQIAVDIARFAAQDITRPPRQLPRYYYESADCYMVYILED